MSRLQRSIQAEIDALLVQLKSNPAVESKLARLQAELARLELARQGPANGTRA